MSPVRQTMKLATIAAGFVGALATTAPSAHAQWYYGPAFDARPVHIGIDGGVAIPTGTFGNNFNTGWDFGANIAIPLGYKSPVWLQFAFNHAQFGATNSLLNAYNATNGWAAVNSGTANLVVNLIQSYGRRPAMITPYLVGGGGIYSRYIELNNFSYYCGWYGCTPYAGTFYSRTDNVGGWDAGAGVRFVARPVRIYIEARYNSALTSGGNTGFVPINIGIEW
jgi:hypothetical protein